jgi:hypothetical protein
MLRDSRLRRRTLAKQEHICICCTGTHICATPTVSCPACYDTSFADQIFFTVVRSLGASQFAKIARVKNGGIGGSGTKSPFDAKLSSLEFKGGNGKELCCGLQLLHLNASANIFPAALRQRYSPMNPDPMSDDQREVMLNPRRPENQVLRRCVRGTYLGFLAQSLCEGHSIRAALKAESFSHTFGYIEVWLCVASRLVEHMVLQPIFSLLPDLYTYLADPRFGDEITDEGKRTEAAGVSREKELYTRLCVLVFEARTHLPEGCYRMKDSDFWHQKFADPQYGNPFDSVSGSCESGAIERIVELHRSNELDWVDVGEEHKAVSDYRPHGVRMQFGGYTRFICTTPGSGIGGFAGS